METTYNVSASFTKDNYTTTPIDVIVSGRDKVVSMHVKRSGFTVFGSTADDWKKIRNGHETIGDVIVGVKTNSINVCSEGNGGVSFQLYFENPEDVEKIISDIIAHLE